jgi:uncharacterized protein (DUF2062 family)
MKFSRKYILNALRTALRQGTTPRKLAITCALGVVIGIFPVWGTTTWICLGLSILFRLNVVIIQLVNYLFFPIQLALILPFIKAGTYIFDLNPFPYSQEELIVLFKTDFWALMKEVGLSLASGIGIWMLIATPLFLVVFYSSYAVFNRWRFNKSVDKIQPTKEF